MKKYILQHGIGQDELLAISEPLNRKYAEVMGYEYLKSDGKRKMPNHPLNYEKIGFLNEILATVDEGAFIIWLDNDAACINTNRDFSSALQEHQFFGMVRCLSGLGKLKARNWWNSGTIVLRSNNIIKSFLARVAKRKEANDEIAIINELHENGFQLGNGVELTSIDNCFNCWRNNEHVCNATDIVVKSFHGIKGVESKLAEMKKFIATLPKIV